MFGSFRSIGKTTVGCTSSDIFVGTTWSPRDDWTAHFLKGAYSGKSPEIRVRDPRELLLHFFKMIARDFETGICTMIPFWSEALHSTVSNWDMKKAGKVTIVAPLLPPVPVSLS